MKTIKNTKIIGIDHGYGNMKTANCCFKTGITAYDTEPLFTGDMLVYDGKYYVIGEGHKEISPEKIKDMDNGKMALSVGVELSYLNSDYQYTVLDAMAQEDCTPSYAQAVRMRKLFRDDALTEDEIYGIMCEEKANQKEKISSKTEDLRRFFSNSYTTQDMEKAILQIVEADYRRRQRSRDRGDR